MTTRYASINIAAPTIAAAEEAAIPMLAGALSVPPEQVEVVSASGQAASTIQMASNRGQHTVAVWHVRVCARVRDDAKGF